MKGAVGEGLWDLRFRSHRRGVDPASASLFTGKFVRIRCDLHTFHLGSKLSEPAMRTLEILLDLTGELKALPSIPKF